MQVIIRRARLIDPQSDFHDKEVDLVIENGTISAVTASVTAKSSVIINAPLLAGQTLSFGDGRRSIKLSADGVGEASFDDLYVSPGWVDAFADYREPGFEHKETIASGMNAAAEGGFTDVMLAPNTQPVLSGKSIVQFVRKQAAGHAVSLHPIGAATQNAEGKDLAEMLDMRHHGAIAFSDGWKPVQSAGLLLKALEYVKAFNGTILQIPVDASLAKGGLMHEGVTSTMLGMAGIPTLSETLLVHRDIELLRYTGSRLHITGISSAESVAMIRKAKAEGLKITCSVTPYHLALTDEALKTYDSMYKVTPPLRTEADRQALIAGLKDGTIDCIATHHRPHEWDAKAKEFEYASEGMGIQDLAFPILWTALKDEVAIDRLVEAMSVIPRDIFDMPVHEIKTGSNASLTLFTTAGTTMLLPENARSLGKNNPFLGHELQGSVIGIFNNGQLHLNS